MEQEGAPTGRELAATLGVREQAVSSWRSGKHRPEGADLERLATALRVEPETLRRDDRQESQLLGYGATQGAVREGAADYQAMRFSLAYWLGRLEEAGGVLDDAAARHQRIRADIAAVLGGEAIPNADERARVVQSVDAAARARAASAGGDDARPHQKRA